MCWEGFEKGKIFGFCFWDLIIEGRGGYVNRIVYSRMKNDEGFLVCDFLVCTVFIL